MASIVGWVMAACFSAELLGYALHRLLHSGAIRFLSRNHMKHHMVLYGPLQDQRSDAYHDSTAGDLSLGNIGMEWLVPAGALIAIAVAAFRFFHVPLVFQLTYFVTTLGWSFLMFSYLHDVMHIEGFWLTKNRWLRNWFLSARRLHDIHHEAINDEGLTNTNFGIGFFFFDRVFGTFLSRKISFNHVGYDAARRRFPSAGEEI